MLGMLELNVVWLHNRPPFLSSFGQVHGLSSHVVSKRTL
jgi:hypothetical protein